MSIKSSSNIFHHLLSFRLRRGQKKKVIGPDGVVFDIRRLIRVWQETESDPLRLPPGDQGGEQVLRQPGPDVWHLYRALLTPFQKEHGCIVPTPSTLACAFIS